MKLSYKILWVDDDRGFFGLHEDEIVNYLESFGIYADITFIEDSMGDSARQKLIPHLKDVDLDLILVDFHMTNLPGDELIQLLRRTDHIYLPVIFYSASSVEELFAAVQTRQLDGVYVTDRRFFFNKVKNVIDSLIVKEQTSKQIRGLLLEGVSEVDAHLCKLIWQTWHKADSEAKENFRKYLFDKKVEPKVQDAKKRHCDFPTDLTEFEELLKSNFPKTTYDTYTRCQLALKLLKILDYSKYQRDILKRFISPRQDFDSLNGLRNNYAHKTRSELDEELTKAFCIYLRQEMRTQIQNIESLLK